MRVGNAVVAVSLFTVFINVHGLRSVNTSKTERESLFTVRTMNEWIDSAASKPVPRRLFGDFWAEGELVILFADTGAGKSALGMQIAESICSGVAIPGFEMEASPQSVLYFDCELNEMQLQRRYAVECRDPQPDGSVRIWFEDHYSFPNTLSRVEMTGGSKVFDEMKDWETFLIAKIEGEIKTSDCKVIIFDNITYLTREGDKGKFALPLMQRLNDLKKEYGLAIMVMAHTPKRDDSRPLTLNDLAGSKILANLADSVFAIGKSQKETTLRYLKQLKARSTELVYDADNVAVLCFEKRKNFLGFEFFECESESEHLAPMTKTSQAETIERAKMLSEQGMSQREIAAELGIGASTVNKYLKL